MKTEENREIRLEAIIQEFEREKSNYDKLESCLINLTRRIVESSDIIPHDISSRRKGRESFIRKIKKPGKVYEKIKDITDIVGIRITTYFESDVDRIKDLIEKEFYIDKDNSIDKRRLHDPDRFGYMSLHYVVSLKPDRLQLTEYSKFTNMKAEIQIRSILQHTWAEIEHDLGYKSKYTIPSYLKRRFSQLSSLLELADREFLQIKNNIEEYDDQVLTLLGTDRNQINIDKNSIIIITEHDAKIIENDKKVCKITSANLISNHDFSENITNMLLWLNIDKVSDLFECIDEFKDDVVVFSKEWISQKEYKEFNYGISLMYICYLVLAKGGDENRINEFAKHFSLGKHVDNFGKHLLTVYSNTVSNTVSDDASTKNCVEHISSGSVI
jgi:ppGpp synthetase/RelA/SpoT-type nucleotidyltranferase